MTGPMDDHALRAGLARLAEAPGVDADVLAAGAMRRGRQRRQRSRGALASVAAAAALAVAVPSLAAPGSSGEQPVDVAGSGQEHDVADIPPWDDKAAVEAEAEETTTTVVEEESGEAPEPVKAPEPKVGDHEAPPVTDKPRPPEAPPTTEKPAPPVPELEELELWCGRGTGEEAGGVVCEVTLSEHPQFASYELRRRCADEVGKPWEVAATYGKRQMPERPWPDIRFFDEGGDPEYPWHYQVLVRNAEGKVIGKSNLAEVGPAEPI